MTTMLWIYRRVVCGFSKHAHVSLLEFVTLLTCPYSVFLICYETYHEWNKQSTDDRLRNTDSDSRVSYVTSNLVNLWGGAFWGVAEGRTGAATHLYFASQVAPSSKGWQRRVQLPSSCTRRNGEPSWITTFPERRFEICTQKQNLCWCLMLFHPFLLGTQPVRADMLVNQ